MQQVKSTTLKIPFFIILLLFIIQLLCSQNKFIFKNHKKNYFLRNKLKGSYLTPETGGKSLHQLYHRCSRSDCSKLNDLRLCFQSYFFHSWNPKKNSLFLFTFQKKISPAVFHNHGPKGSIFYYTLVLNDLHFNW